MEQNEITVFQRSIETCADPAGQRERDGSPVMRIMREVEMRYPGLAARMRECMTSPHHSSKEMDFAFFRMVVESRR